MEKPEIPAKRKAGRPLGFDRDAALHQAMLLFWRHGYEATSVSDLVSAMAITPPSLYTAFGDKKQLFLEAVQLYVSGPVTSASIIEEAATAREAAMNLLKAAAVGFTGKATPAGCLLATSAISCSASAADVQKAVSEIRLDIEQRLRIRIASESRSGSSTMKVDAGTLASFVMALIQGLSTLARDGASQAKLLTVVDVAMQTWPDKLSKSVPDARSTPRTHTQQI